MRDRAGRLYFTLQGLAAPVLLSMTGFGEARDGVAQSHVSAELRSVNHRHFKLTLRCPETLARFEADIERVLRETISRGALTLALRLDQSSSEALPRINQAVLGAYWRQLQAAAAELGAAPPDNLQSLVPLPGVLENSDWSEEQLAEAWPDLERLVRAAAERFQQFRRQEGAAMAADLAGHCTMIETELNRVAALAPQVIAEYRERLQQRIQDALQTANVQLNPNDLLREVALFTDRADISEEIVRLRSHLQQFRQLLEASQSQGRKLEFLCQEMFREANTIGSKSNHVGVAHAAMEIKTSIERMREVVLNVE